MRPDKTVLLCQTACGECDVMLNLLKYNWDYLKH